MNDLFESGVKKAAVLSGCGLYRYRLSRVWDESLSAVLWCCLNPSTADAEIDDPSIRRMVGFARAWGYGGIEVVNLFAWRATDPAELRTHTSEKVGPDNDRHILEASGRSGLRVAAWGVHGVLFDRGRHVLSLLRLDPRPVFHLGLTKDGHPKHPLYLRGDTKPIPFGVVGGEPELKE